MSLSPGTQLGVYEISGSLGAGGMGEVYRATDTKLGREVAIKTQPASLASDKDRLARFEREAKLLASLNHAHIAVVHSLDEHEGTLYIAMELVEGESLEEKLKSGPLPIDDALRCGLQIAEALEAAHAKGVVHRDLKPANVMVTPDGVVKVLDFGLAKAFMGDPNEASPAHSPAPSMAMTQAGLVLGTGGYMSPEQASGQATDQRADIWSFGVVLYEMLTGQPVFSGESVPHILAAVLQLEPDWSRLPKQLHPRLKATLKRCLQKKVRNRYHSIADVRIEIEEAVSDPAGTIVDGTSVPASPYAAASARTSVWRRALPMAAAVVVTAVLAVFAALSLRPPPPPQLPVRSADRLAEDQAFLVPQLPVIDIGADGRAYVYATSSGLKLRSMDSFEPVQIPGLDAGALPELSPDARSLAFLTQGPTTGGAAQIELARMPVTGGSPRPLGIVGNNTDPPYGLSWEPDDTIVYARADGIWRISPNGGSPVRIIESARDERPEMAQMLPGGEWVLFSVLHGEGTPDWDTAEIVAQSLATGERRTLYSGGSSARYVPSGHLVFAFGATLYALPFDVDAVEVTGVPVDAGNATLIVADAQGHVDSLPMPGGVYADARVSFDGRFAAYTVTYPDGNDIAVYELNGNSAPRRLTFGGMSRYPVWSQDGTHVVFQSTRDGTASLYSQLADGSGGEPERLTTAAEGESHVPDSASPDGQWLTFTVADESGSSVWSLNLETDEAEPLLTKEGASISQSVFSPNGRWIAYQSSETGGIEVFVQPFPPTGAKFQLPEPAQNHHAGWSADGSSIFRASGVLHPLGLRPSRAFVSARSRRSRISR